MPDASEPNSPQPTSTPAPDTVALSTAQTLGSATYEIIRQRLNAQGGALRECMARLNARRAEVFGSIEFKLLQADRILTSHNCIPADMVQLGAGRFLFGFNVQFGLKKEIELSDVFAIYTRDEQAGTFKEAELAVLQDKTFVTDFKRLYNVYEKASFQKFSVIEGRLFMVFSTGPGINDIAVFKWAYNDDNLKYIDGRSEAEFRKVGFPPTFEFRWLTPDRESYRYGDYPHISIEDRVFVECIGGDLTIKVEDNTATGEGIYAEPVDDKYQKVDDAEIAYAVVNHLILLKIRPYKETTPRFFIFNGKTQSAVRVDSIGESCVFLPEEHGLIFPDGYYLATGELKQFQTKDRPMVIERVIHAPNGEDVLFAFYNRFTGEYALLPYRLIAQKVEERIGCPGFSLFPNGHLLVFRAEAEPQKHHMIQLRQTPFHQPGYEPAGKKDAYLYQVGNKEVVRCLAECNEVMTLVRKENPYAELYTDLVKRCGAILDSNSWLSSADGFGVDAALRRVREVADKAVDEFDKVRRLQREAVEHVTSVRKRCTDQFQNIRRASFRVLNDFVLNLATLRKLRGELITLKEVRYVDVRQVEELEKQIATQTDELSSASVKFLLKPEALEPYRRQAADHLGAVDRVTKVAEGKEIEKAVAQAGGELEMLIEIVNGLKIEDATETTRIIDAITAVYSTLNQVKAALKKRLQHLVVSEGAAQFAAQMKLLGQAASSYLDLCDTPAKCEEYLNRLSVQLEELEGTFADFEEYTVQLAERRTELYEAFEQRKVALVEQRNRRASALMTAAERILKVIQNRLAGFKSIEDINSYMASDLMIAKVRETIDQLLGLGDSVKADDLQGRLKSTQQEAVRQLKDRQELFAGGTNVIKLGKHHFNINTQPLELTVVNRDGVQHIHLTSTKYFEAITDEAFLATRDVWDQEVVSENRDVYRAEYLAWQMLKALEDRSAGFSPLQRGDGETLGTPSGPRSVREVKRPDGRAPSLAEALAFSDEKRLAFVQEFMGARYQEGYTKGIHDLDGAKIFHALLTTHHALQLARFSPAARACAVAYWNRFCPEETRTLWSAKLNAFAERNRLFPGDPTQQNYIAALQGLVSAFAEQTQLYPKEFAAEAGEYLFNELIAGESFSISQEADRLVASFTRHLASKGSDKTFEQRRQALTEHAGSELDLVRDWVRGFLLTQPEAERYLEEVAAFLFCGDTIKRAVVKAATSQAIEGMKGSHALIQGSKYQFDYLNFQVRLQRFQRDVVPRFEKFHALKQELVERERGKLRLNEFKPKVLTSFVRNQLIDQIYLPLVGDNLAKQIGAAGDAKRTDLMGLLLVISPPGYGKTTLMEYVASRLGIVFIKINGPALGHNVVSLDPEEAPNAAAREEIIKLNLALEMGDNAMICVDDIQHCNPEFLQKFISLCDGQRRIEGVWRGKPRTYDLRGRKVVVVMAGNPYTESGQKFKIPDMLANRADTYNLGDIIGGNADYFKASYLENAITSNAALAPLANKSQKDIRSFIRMAESGEREAEGFEGSYSSQEVEEILSVMKKLVMIRQVILRVNQEYIHSAAQSDEFRTEPPFRLQGSYRNMNRLAEKVVTIMNDDEVRALILDHYRGESQTLTTGTEANMLKFKELIGAQAAEEKTRWEDIKKTFKYNTAARGAGGDNDPAGRIVAQLSGFQSGLEGIQKVIADQLAKPPTPPSVPQVVIDMTPVGKGLEALQAAFEKQAAKPQPVPPPPSVVIDLAPLAANLEALRNTVDQRLAQPAKKDDKTNGDFNVLAAKLGEGLNALRQDLSRAISVVHSGTMADAMKRMEHEMEMVHSTLATLKDMAARQRDHLQKSQELLEIRAKQGSVEVEVTQEMLGNESAFLEHFQKAIAEAQKQREAAGGEEPPPKQ